MPRGWRITRSTRVARVFDGEGARIFGGRWNGPRTALVYTAQSESLAALGLLVHLHSGEMLPSYSAIPVDFDEELPSAIVPSEHNYPLNPRHPRFRRIAIGRAHRFRFDPR